MFRLLRSGFILKIASKLKLECMFDITITLSHFDFSKFIGMLYKNII